MAMGITVGILFVGLLLLNRNTLGYPSFIPDNIGYEGFRPKYAMGLHEKIAPTHEETGRGWGLHFPWIAAGYSNDRNDSDRLQKRIALRPKELKWIRLMEHTLGNLRQFNKKD